MADIVDVAQLVIRSDVDDSFRYLLARRTEDGYTRCTAVRKVIRTLGTAVSVTHFKALRSAGIAGSAGRAAEPVLVFWRRK